MERTLRSKIAVSLCGLALIVNSLSGCIAPQPKPAVIKPAVKEEPVVVDNTEVDKRYEAMIAKYPKGTVVIIKDGYWIKGKEAWERYYSNGEEEPITDEKVPDQLITDVENSATVYQNGFPPNHPYNRR